MKQRVVRELVRLLGDEEPADEPEQSGDHESLIPTSGWAQSVAGRILTRANRQPFVQLSTSGRP
jgi:hypothetical protein